MKAYEERPDRSEVISELRRLADSYRQFHVQKENTSWVAVGALFALVAALIAIMFTQDINNEGVILLAFFGTVFTLFFFVFTVVQLKIKEKEQQALNATERLIAKTVSKKIDITEIDLHRCDKYSFIPKSVEDEIKANGVATMQKGTFLFAVLAHALLVVALIASAYVCVG